MAESSAMSHQIESGCLIARIKEHFDEKNCFQIQDAILELLKKADTHLILDLNHVHTIRSSGLRVILYLIKRFKDTKNRFVVLYSKNDTNHQVSQILKVSGFDKITDIYPTQKEAIQFCLDQTQDKGSS